MTFDITTAPSLNLIISSTMSLHIEKLSRSRFSDGGSSLTTIRLKNEILRQTKFFTFGICKPYLVHSFFKFRARIRLRP